MITSDVELSGSIKHIDVDSDTDIRVKLGVTYHCTEQFSVGISYVTLDNLDKLAIKASYYF